MNQNTNKIWINPVTVIKLFTKTAGSLYLSGTGVLDMVKMRKYKPSAEGWATALYYLAREKGELGAQFFIQKNEIDPPDFFGLELNKSEGLLRGYVRGIEVFRYVDESKFSLLGEIQKKIAKAYSSDTILLCHITRKDFKQTLGQIHDDLAKLKPQHSIWIIGSDEEGDQLVSEVYPGLRKMHIDIKGILARDSNPAFLEGYQGKSEDVLFYGTGKRLLLTPEFELKEIN